MMRDIAARARARIELRDAAAEIADEPLWPRPLRQFGLLPKYDGEHVGDGAFLHHDSAVHIGFAEFELGIYHYAAFRCAAGKPHRRRWRRAVTDRECGTARGRDPERAAPDEGLEQVMKQPIHRPPRHAHH